MSLLKYLIVTSLCLTACAQTPQRTASTEPTDKRAAQTNAETDSADSDGLAGSHAALKTVKPANYPNVPLTEDLLYQYLVSEIANQRGEGLLATESSTELAKKTRDPRVAQRAAQIAVESGEMSKAVDSYRLLETLDPNAGVANRMLGSILLRGGKLDEAELEFGKVLKANPDSLPILFMQICQMAATYPNRPEVLKMMQNLAKPYPKVAEAHWSVSHLAFLAEKYDLALDEAREAKRLREDWSAAVAMEAQILQKTAPKQGIEVLRRFLDKYPAVREIRMQYARALLEQKQYPSAREEFAKLAKENPNNPDLPFAVAMIALQLSDYAGAEEQLKLSLAKGKKEPDVVRFYLGQVNEMLSHEDEALIHYREVKGGEFFLDARLRTVFLLNKRGNLDEARKLLQSITPENNTQRVRLLMVENELLREAKQFEAGYDVLRKGLDQLPNNPDLLYETAMMADKVGKPNEFERLMRRLIQVRPDLPHAYNALGYSLLERKDNISEAIELIQKALQLAPDDVAIIDSMGWAYYHTGKFEQSIKLLRKAFAANPDPEIAAHLGEVLWVKGEKNEAKKIWQESLKANPDSVYLQRTMKKFDAQ